MEDLLIFDLDRDSQAIARAAEAGEMFLVTKNDRLLFVGAHPANQRFVDSGITADLACQLVARGMVTLGVGALIAHQPLETFIETAGKRGVVLVDYPGEEILEELERLGVTTGNKMRGPAA